MAKAGEIDGFYRERFENWLKFGYNAQMHWIEKNAEIRFDPTLLLENAKTVIVLLQGQEPPQKLSFAPNKIARYASQKEDYHVSIKRKLKLLAGQIGGIFPDAKFRVCVDSSPVLEKYWAWKAGLGFIGKNTLFISHALGSFCNIGILLTDVDFALEESACENENENGKNGEANFCETCDKCVSSCPTGALVKPYTLDCNLCISYITQQRRRQEETQGQKIEIDAHGWLLGCDVCQEVCPRNASLQITVSL